MVLTNRSLAAYGIDPSTAVADEPLEDGGVEEEDEDDSDDDSDDDDIKIDMTTGPQRVLDLRCAYCSVLCLQFQESTAPAAGKRLRYRQMGQDGHRARRSPGRNS
jgi:hypothetical protein